MCLLKVTFSSAANDGLAAIISDIKTDAKREFIGSPDMG
jgi:hypothetical protein